MELLLLRHSVTPGNLKRQYIGSTDQPLAPEGRRWPGSAGEMPEIGGLWVSPCYDAVRRRRCCSRVEQRQVPQLRECAFGRFGRKDLGGAEGRSLYRAWMGAT